MFFSEKQQDFKPLDKEMLDTMLEECEKEMFSSAKKKASGYYYFAAEINHNARVGRSYPVSSLTIS